MALDELQYDWNYWARPDQRTPQGRWNVWAIVAGRGFGKTLTGAQFVRQNMCGSTPLARGRCQHVALIAENADEARKVMIGDGKRIDDVESSGLLQVHPPDFRPKYEPALKRVTWPNGAIGSIYYSTEPEGLRGPQHDLAWCFVAGTMVATSIGDRPIESLRAGDMVVTRQGACPVLEVASRLAPVGRARFGNGAELLGTADHPIYTPHGWMRLDGLKRGDQVCAVDVSNGAAKSGTSESEGITSHQLRVYIANYGKLRTALSRLVVTFITRTKTKPITICRTLNVLRSLSTRVGIVGSNLCDAIGFQNLRPLSSAVSAAATFSERGSRSTPHACGASSSPLMRRGLGQNVNAVNAARSLLAAPATIAVSVASTWQREGERVVHCLKVGGASEYFANGILVHNCDEFAKWKYVQETWDQLQFGMRMGDPLVCLTTTPKPIKTLKEILLDPTTVITRGSTFDNAANLPEKFLQTVLRKYEGTRIGRQELLAELLEDVEGAMWNRTLIDALRRRPNEVPPLVRVVVAIDPAVSSGEESDETGIVVAGLGVDGHGYVFDDLSGTYTPNEWGLKAIAAYRNPMRPADRVIGEKNNGGEMIEHTLRVIDSSVSYKAVTASHGKVTRAEPVSALYEKKLVHHVGAFPQLEDQMCEFTTGFDRKTAGYSPDRMDALVWALTELKLENQPGGLFELYKQQAAEIRTPEVNHGFQIPGGQAPVTNVVPDKTQMANQPRIEANTVRMLAPKNISQVYGGLGNVYNIPGDRIITVTREDYKVLLGQGFTAV